MALLQATCFGNSPCASHLAPMLRVDVLHSTISVCLANEICLGRPYPSHARPIALLFSRYFRVRSLVISPMLVTVADHLST